MLHLHLHDKRVLKSTTADGLAFHVLLVPQEKQILRKERKLTL
jgi:hypothetical protein